MVKRKIWIASKSDYLGAHTGSSATPILLLRVDADSNAAYEWNTGEITIQVKTSVFGTYWLVIEHNGCRITDTENVFSLPKPFVNIGNDTIVSIEKPVTLNARNSSAIAYLWNTGTTAPVLTVNHAGIYYVAVTGNTCVETDTVTVIWGDCGVFIPGAFTPNGDGINDNFGVVTGFRAREFFLQIFDRWGNTVFITSNNTIKWNGNFKRKAVLSVAYAWIMNYVDINGIKNSLKGTVLLIL